MIAKVLRKAKTYLPEKVFHVAVDDGCEASVVDGEGAQPRHLVERVGQGLHGVAPELQRLQLLAEGDFCGKRRQVGLLRIEHAQVEQVPDFRYEHVDPVPADVQLLHGARNEHCAL